MNFSVGILYSAQSFLELIKNNQITEEEFSLLFKKYVVADSKYILKTAIDCNWVKIEHNNQITITSRGIEVLSCSESYQRLRLQIAHLIATYKPSWASLIIYGRKEAVKYFSSEIKQCFDEAYLLEGYEIDVVEWWDKLSFITKGISEDVRLLLGRRGEKLSIEYEYERTKVSPIWQSIDSNLSGYDILSQLDKTNEDSLIIEVKATNSKKDISLIISKGEWNVAEKSSNYIFHVWSFYPLDELYIITKVEMEKHIPINKGNGEWKNVEITFTREELQKYKITLF